MRSVLCVVAVLLVGCGGSDEIVVRCEVAPFAEVSSDAPAFDCTLGAHKAQLAREVLVGRGLVSEAEFLKAFSGVHVWVSAESWLEETDSTVTAGEHRGNHIRLGRYMGSLAHELLHRRDYVRGLDTTEHQGWPENGNNEADEAYRAALAR